MQPAEQVVAWRTGPVLLAIPLERIVEVAPVNAAGEAVSREGAMELSRLERFPDPERPRRALVLRRAGGERIAIGADAVLGVRPATPADRQRLPAWLEGIDAAHIDAVVSLDDGELAALLTPDALETP